MSHLAYRVRQVFAREPSFDAQHDHDLVNFIENESEFGYYEWLHEGDGLVPVPVEVMERAVKMAKKLKLSREKVHRIQSDIVYAKSRGYETIDYSIF